jgi:Protein of unknown function (DUF1203)
MKNFKIVPIMEEVANAIRTSGTDTYGNNILVQVAKGKGPCRQSLLPFKKGVDKRILFSYNPFDKPGLYAESGPVFMSEKPGESYKDIYRFPPEIKADKESFPLSLIGYNENDMMVFSEQVGNADVDEMIEKIFNEMAEVHYLHARNSEACCFICKIERI